MDPFEVYKTGTPRGLYLETPWFWLYIGPDCHRKDNSYGWGIVLHRWAS